MKKRLLVIPFLTLISQCTFTCNVPTTDKPELPFYDVELELIPQEGFVKVEGSLKYIISEDSLQELKFGLHKSFDIALFSINGDNSYHIDSTENVRWLPDAIKVVCPIDYKYRKGDIVTVSFSYNGVINQWPEWSANVITEDWVEMGFYFPWYPSIFGDFNYKLTIDIDPEYNVFAMGNYTEDKGKHIFETEFPVWDFIICTSKDLAIHETTLNNQSFQVVNASLSEHVVDTMQLDIVNFYRFFSESFGEIESHRMSLVISKREKGGGYSRKGGLFLGGMSDSSYLNNRIDNIKYLAHEIAHYWWLGAPGNWQDWLNESFAEFSALLLIRELYSEKEYNSRLNKMKEQIINTPPVWGIQRNDPKASMVLYSKGAILLFELEQKIGTEQILALCKARVKNKIIDTKQFLSLIEEKEGKEVAHRFERELKTR